METLQLLQQLATAPRYGRQYTHLVNSSIEGLPFDLMIKDNKFASQKIWGDDGFQANVVIQVDLD